MIILIPYLFLHKKYSTERRLRKEKMSIKSMKGGIREIAFFDKVHKDISLLNYIAAISVFLKALLIPKLVRLSSKSLQEKTPIP